MYPSIQEKNDCLKRYEEALKLKNPKLPKLDHWYRVELRKEVLKRLPKPYLTLDELIKLMEWKLTRGKFRPMLKSLILKNSDEEVRKHTSKGFQELESVKKFNDIENISQNLRTILDHFCLLKGVGIATASAILSILKPNVFPFMSDEALYFTEGEGQNGSNRILSNDKPKYNFNEYFYLTKAIENQIDLNQPCLENVEQFEKSVWSFGILKANKLLKTKEVKEEDLKHDSKEDQKKRKKVESSPSKNTKRKKKS